MKSPRALGAAILLALCSVWAAAARADDVHVAVAANFTAAARELAAAFEADSGHHAVLSFGSTGKLYTQIAHGAPFEVFLAADRERPAKAEAAGLAVPHSRHTYARGRLALFSLDPELVDPAGAVLTRPAAYARLAIANPATAPYGAAAVEALRALGVYAQVEDKLVRGESIAQAYQFVATGNAPLGLVALSQVIDQPRGSRWLVPQTLYTPLDQDAVLLERGRGNPAASAFLAYLRGDKARAIIRRHGYATD